MLILVASRILLLGAAVAAVGMEDISFLRKDVLSNYDKNIRPVMDHETIIEVKLGLSINSISLNEKKQSMLVTGWMALRWTDDFLLWDPDLYSNINQLHFGSDEIWQPEVGIFNSLDNNGYLIKMSDVPLLVGPDGTVRWFPPFSAEVPCLLDISNWPVDSHECKFDITSWSKYSEGVSLAHLHGEDKVMMTNYEKDLRWNLTDCRSEVKNETFQNSIMPKISYTFRVVRNPAGEAFCIISATFAVFVMVISSYGLPMTQVLPRILLHVSSLTLLVIGDTLVATKLPGSNGNIPDIVKYYSGLIIATLASLVMTILVFCVLIKVKNIDIAVPVHGRTWKTWLCSIFFSDEGKVNNLLAQEEVDNARPLPKSDSRTFFRIVNATLAISFGLIYFFLYINIKSLSK